MTSSKLDVLTALASTIVPVEVGTATLHVRTLTVAELLAVQARVKALPEGQRDVAATNELVLMAACTADGEPLFGPEDRAAIERAPYHLVEKIADAVNRVNGLGGGAVDAKKKN